MKDNKIDRKCRYYSWVFPRDYGARCEFHNAFFDSNLDCRHCIIKLEEQVKKLKEI